jgi:hypothetical protein
VCSGPGPSPLGISAVTEVLETPQNVSQRLRSVSRFVVGSLAGLAFVPIALLMTLRARRGRS